MTIYAIFSKERMIGYSTTPHKSNSETTVETKESKLLEVLNSNFSEEVEDFRGYTGYLKLDSENNIVFNDDFKPADDGG